MEELYLAMQALRARRYIVRQLKVRCGYAVYSDIVRMPPGGPVYGPITLDMLYGYPVLLDEWLPPRVWRLTDETDTLLYDCREGKTRRSW